MKNKVIVIAPHADDEIIGCGATIARYINRRDEVYIVIATNASKGAPDLFSKSQIDIIRKEALEAHNFLGVTKTFFLDLPAPGLNAYPEFKISLELSNIISEVQPNIMYLPHPGDIHQDHKAIYRSSLVAARPQGDYSIKEIYCYETLSETEWTPNKEEPFVPNMFVEVEDFLEIKKEAMTFFKSQLKNFPHSRSLEVFEALAMYRGATIGVKAAEAFSVERIIHNKF